MIYETVVLPEQTALARSVLRFKRDHGLNRARVFHLRRPQMSKDNTPPSVCKWCDSPAHIKQGRIWLCKKHYRFQQMRSTAKRDNKTVPSYDQLESLWLECQGKCFVCRRAFNWLSVEGRATVVTLQHDRSGSMRLLCVSCNTRHAFFDGDSFYEADQSHRTCPRCEHNLPLSVFAADNYNRWNNKKTYCRACSAKYHAEYVANNRKKYNATRRAYYHRRKAAGNPIPR